MYENLKKKAKEIRIKVLDAVFSSKKGHIGGTFSCTDLFVALYYGNILNVKSEDPKWDLRDRLVIGKGHSCLALYNIFVDLGFFDLSRLNEYGSDGSSLGGQLNIDTPGVEFNTGSLGHAVGVAAGMAIRAKLDKKDYKVFALIGDGECDEGSIWESVMFASQYNLNNLITIVDRNRLSVTEVILDENSSKLEEKFKGCGWDCIVIDGHCFKSIMNVLLNLENRQKPLVILADTVKGKGISFMENGIKWHHSVPNKEEFETARKELQKGI